MRSVFSIATLAALPAAFFGLLLPTGKAEEFALVKEGTALAPLVLSANATPRNREAAEELADAIKNISGADIEIIEASPASPPERAVWIGVQPGMEALFPSVDLSLHEPEEIRIVTSKAHVLARWERSAAMRESFPPFAISWGRTFRTDVPAGSIKRTMYGLHPELRLSGRFLQEYLDGTTAVQDEME